MSASENPIAWLSTRTAAHLPEKKDVWQSLDTTDTLGPTLVVGALEATILFCLAFLPRMLHG